MIVNAAVRDILKCSPGDEIVVANREDYFNGNPLYKEVTDIIKDNGKLVILIRDYE